MEGKFQYQGQLDQDLKYWLSPIWSQNKCGFLSEDDKQDSTLIEGLDPEVSTIENKSPEGKISTIVVIKFSEKLEGSGDKIYDPMCIQLYKEEGGSIVPLSVIDTYSKMNFFTWSKEENGFIVPGDEYNE